MLRISISESHLNFMQLPKLKYFYRISWEIPDDNFPPTTPLTYCPGFSCYPGTCIEQLPFLMMGWLLKIISFWLSYYCLICLYTPELCRRFLDHSFWELSWRLTVMCPIFPLLCIHVCFFLLILLPERKTSVFTIWYVVLFFVSQNF